MKALYLFAAALQVDCVDETPLHNAIATAIAQRWPALAAQDRRSLEEAKLNLVRRFGEAVRMMADQHPGQPDAPAYRELYDITIAEPSYPIRVEGAQEIGAGGDNAFNVLKRPLVLRRAPVHPPGRRHLTKASPMRPFPQPACTYGKGTWRNFSGERTLSGPGSRRCSSGR